MTLTRPAWHATLTNHTQGWAYETYQGEPFDDEDPPAVRLLDNWSADWSHRDSQQWEPLEPVSTSVAIAVQDVDDLPPVNYDDEMSLHVVRPVTVGDPIVWFHAFGGVSDLDADADFQSDCRLKITFVDPRAAAGTRTHVKTDEPFLDNFGMGNVAGMRGTGPWTTYPFADPGGVAEGASFAEVWDLYATIYARPGWVTWRMAHRLELSELPAGSYFSGPDTVYRQYWDNWPIPQLEATDPMPTLFELVVSAGVLTIGSFDPDVTPNAMTVLPASAIRSPVPWKKDSGNGDVAVDATGFAADDSEILVTVGPEKSAAKTTRVTLPTLLTNVPDLTAAAAHRREMRKETANWRSPSMTLDTSLLTDEQVDYLADGRLWPRVVPDDLDKGIPVVAVVGAHPQSNLSGAIVFGLPVGATFNLAGGRLLIDVDLSAWDVRSAPLPESVPGPTYAAFQAAFPTIDYDHVDPSLTYDDLKLADL